MTLVEKMITLARRYCMDNYQYWSNRYLTERTGKDYPYTYSKSDYNLFPRYLALDAILKNIETIVDKPYVDLEQCQSELKHMGLTAQSLFTEGNKNEIEWNAIEDERSKFISFINDVSLEQIQDVQPLPYRRKLTILESARIREDLLRFWGFDGSYWEPLVSCSKKPFIFFDKENLGKEDFQKIQNIIVGQSQETVFEINEDRWDSEIARSEINPDCYEIIYAMARMKEQLLLEAINLYLRYKQC